MADETTEQENDGLVLTDEDNEPATLFPTGGGEVEGLIGINGTTKLTWDDLAEPQKVCYLWDNEGGRYYLTAQFVNGYIKLDTYFGQ